jgi:cytochrome c peroxidase
MLGGADGFVLAWEKLPAQSPLLPKVDRGRRLFHTSDSRISEDGRACASCHPDGRDDGLVWSTPDGPRNPPMLAGRVRDTEPYGWLGGAKDLGAHLELTLSRLGGKKLSKDDRDALVAYVAWMKPPAVEDANASDPLALQGRRIFESTEAGCGMCHGHEGQSPDGMRHNVMSWAEGDRTGVLDTPSLRFVGGTAPYFHDGRYATLRALLTRTRGTMGQERKLTDQELDALGAYMRTL